MKLVTWAGASLMMVLAQVVGAQDYPNNDAAWGTLPDSADSL